MNIGVRLGKNNTSGVSSIPRATSQCSVCARRPVDAGFSSSARKWFSAGNFGRRVDGPYADRRDIGSSFEEDYRAETHHEAQRWRTGLGETP